jgi:hypothetical protein
VSNELRDLGVTVCVCVNVYSGEDGAIQKLLSGHLSLFRSMELTSHII